jgi:hypothetical protein
MGVIELMGDIDSQHRLRAQVPADLLAGPDRLIFLLPHECAEGIAWAQVSRGFRYVGFTPDSAV